MTSDSTHVTNSRSVHHSNTTQFTHNNHQLNTQPHIAPGFISIDVDLICITEQTKAVSNKQ